MAKPNDTEEPTTNEPRFEETLDCGVVYLDADETGLRDIVTNYLAQADGVCDVLHEALQADGLTDSHASAAYCVLNRILGARAAWNELERRRLHGEDAQEVDHG